jgi:hypothetical protein
LKLAEIKGQEFAEAVIEAYREPFAFLELIETYTLPDGSYQTWAADIDGRDTLVTTFRIDEGQTTTTILSAVILTLPDGFPGPVP